MSKENKDSKQKKPGLMTRLFSSRKMSVESPPAEDPKNDNGKASKGDSSHKGEGHKDDKRKKLQRMQTVDPAALKKRTEDDVVADALGKDKPKSGDSRPKKLDKQKSDTSVGKGRKSSTAGAKKSSGGGGGTGGKARGGKSKRRRGKKGEVNIEVNIDKPIDWPAVPEVVLAYHRKKPFLNNNEEWLLVELNEYECLVENLDILKIIAKHSKFFEVEPDELWDEFFEFMEEVPTYDEIINYDVWQEFRDEKYPY